MWSLFIIGGHLYIFEWFKQRLRVKNRSHQKVTCDDEIGLCAQNRDMMFHSNPNSLHNLEGLSDCLEREILQFDLQL